MDHLRHDPVARLAVPPALRATARLRRSCSAARLSSGGEQIPVEPADEPALERGLGGVRVVSLPDPRDGFVGRHPRHHGDAGERRPRASATAVAGDLDSLVGRPLVRGREHGHRLDPVPREPEVGPIDPCRLPVRRWWLLAQQIQTELGPLAGRRFASQPAPSDEPTIRELDHTGPGSPWIETHPRSVPDQLVGRKPTSAPGCRLDPVQWHVTLYSAIMAR